MELNSVSGRRQELFRIQFRNSAVWWKPPIFQGLACRTSSRRLVPAAQIIQPRRLQYDVRIYVDVLGAEQGALVYMTSGEIEWINPRGGRTRLSPLPSTPNV